MADVVRYEQITNDKPYLQYGVFVRAIAKAYANSEFRTQALDHPWKRYQSVLEEIRLIDLTSVTNLSHEQIELIVEKLQDSRDTQVTFVRVWRTNKTPKTHLKPRLRKLRLIKVCSPSLINASKPVFQWIPHNQTTTS